jgi:hypothetical protein
MPTTFANHIALGTTCVLNVDGLVYINKLNKSNNRYIGTDFSDFVYKRKTGEIVLGSMDNLSAFDVKISEDWLIEKGFTKKVI